MRTMFRVLKDKNRLHLVYFVLAGFDVLTICCALFLSHHIMNKYSGAVQTSQIWAGRLGEITLLGEFAQQTNAPGNDVFDSGDVERERARRDLALAAFNAKLASIEAELTRNVAPAARAEIDAALAHARVAMAGMVAEADYIFGHFDAERPALAGRRMASMDRAYAKLTSSIAAGVNAVQVVQLAHLERENASANSLRQLEWVMGAVVLLIVICVTIYGHRVGRIMRRTTEELNFYAKALEDERNQLESRVAERTEELSQASAQALAASEAKSQFLATMSHELRTPLSSIISYAEVLREGAEEESRVRDVDDLNVILGASGHLLGLISDVLNMSKVEAGKMELDVSDFDLGQLVEALARSVRPLVEKNSNSFIVLVDSGVAEVRTDKVKLNQCLLNLLSNAAKFTTQGKVTLSVAAMDHGAAAWIEFVVSDTGIGMSPDQLARLFKPFSQADASTTRRFGGTGLGLSISKAFAEMLGGTLQVESAKGEGTTFRLLIPADLQACERANDTSIEIGAEFRTGVAA